jgi:hypothetical protein
VIDVVPCLTPRVTHTESEKKSVFEPNSISVAFFEAGVSFFLILGARVNYFMSTCKLLNSDPHGLHSILTVGLSMSRSDSTVISVQDLASRILEPEGIGV